MRLLYVCIYSTYYQIPTLGQAILGAGDTVVNKQTETPGLRKFTTYNISNYIQKNIESKPHGQ